MHKWQLLGLLIPAISATFLGCSKDSTPTELQVTREDQAVRVAEFVDGSPAWTLTGQDVIFQKGYYTQNGPIVLGMNEVVIVPYGEVPNSPWSLAMSPDGSRLAFTGRDSLFGGSRRIYLASFPNGELTPLINEIENPAWLSWAPDGNRLAFSTNWNTNAYIGILDLNDNSVIPLANDSGNDVHPAWSPDGTKIAFSSDSTGQWEVWSMTVEGTKRVQLTVGGGNNPTWSPLGDRICYELEDRLWVMGSDGSEPYLLSELPGSYPNWSPSGNEIAFVAKIPDRPVFTSLWILPID